MIAAFLPQNVPHIYRIGRNLAEGYEVLLTTSDTTQAPLSRSTLVQAITRDPFLLLAPLWIPLYVDVPHIL
jgi:hypothetical protein